MANVDFLFKRFSPKNKLEMIKSLDIYTLLHIPEDIIKRCVKEAGSNILDGKWFKTPQGGRDYKTFKSRRKELSIYNEDDKHPGNNWNSCVSKIYENSKHQLVFEVYLQGDDIDTDDYVLYSDLNKNIYWAELHEEFRNGYEHTIRASYDNKDKAEIVRAVLLTYVKNKYHDKLSK